MGGMAFQTDKAVRCSLPALRTSSAARSLGTASMLQSEADSMSLSSGGDSESCTDTPFGGTSSPTSVLPDYVAATAYQAKPDQAADGLDQRSDAGGKEGAREQEPEEALKVRCRHHPA